MKESEEERKGFFVVFYGINNLGKSTQIDRVSDLLRESGRTVGTMKYPIYDLEPTGDLINSYLRKHNPQGLSPREVQILYAMNRTQSAEELNQAISDTDIFISEDYSGTSLAWGMGADVDKDFLVYINSHLREPDLSILFDGERFTEAVESEHKHETNDTLTDRVRQYHIDLANEFGWKVIDANQAMEDITQEIAGLIVGSPKKLKTDLDIAIC